ncbi:diguanylate cyclase domain-containing protein [Aromatoleum bremense]|uniref:Diguanylate cyclase n=1 Tax=Aromatoleum bremense TaxID=76115 RepID=A0ABX1NV60_9RHOO|nr:diguanylate cyclase [Aromatoleum bremense]NMG15899.1 diguanylate cyclase [Aromatoleum bremense]
MRDRAARLKSNSDIRAPRSPGRSGIAVTTVVVLAAAPGARAAEPAARLVECLEAAHLGLAFYAGALAVLLLSIALIVRRRSLAREQARLQAEALASREQLIRTLQASEQALTQGLAQRSQELEAATRRLQETELRLQYAAHNDPLTGLANRLLLGDRIAQGITRSKRHNCRTAVVLVNIDDFKGVNAAFGEALGDEVLKAVGARLRSIVREQDTVARPGGDEFVIVLEEVFDAQDVQRVASAAATALAQEFEARGHAVILSASIGCAIYPDGGTDADGLLRHAGKLMRRAKRGKGLPPRQADPAASAA